MQELQRRIEELQGEFDKLKNQSTIPYEVEQAFRARITDLTSNFPANLANAPLASITAPSGGGTIDSQARTAISTIISRLQSLGLIN